MKKYDFLVLGSGPAGQRAAVQAAKVGKRVAIIEQRAVVGGVSLHTGTIPSKALREAALYLTGWNQRGLYGRGYRLKAKVTLEDLFNRLHITVQHEMQVMQDQLSRNNITVVQGTASFTSPYAINVEGMDGSVIHYEADKILISTGSYPICPEGVVLNDSTIINSDALLKLNKTPRSMAIIGGGVIGVEYASMFCTLDIKVTLVDGRATLMPFLDREIVDELIHQLRGHGVVLRLAENVIQVQEDPSGHVITTLDSGKKICTDVVLFTAGRMGCTAQLRLENAGITADERLRIPVNVNFQTAAPHIYAAGDVIGFPSLASTSMEQGRRAACHAFNVCEPGRLTNFPLGIYSVPEISVVGFTEEELTAKRIPYEVGIARFCETARGQIMGVESGFLKILVGLPEQKILGVHIIGEGATELIHIGQAVLVLGGSLTYFMENAFNYPTLAEAYKVAALDAWNRVGSLTQSRTLLAS